MPCWPRRDAAASRPANGTPCCPDLRLLPEAVDTQADAAAWSATLELAEAHRLTIYDAAYLELALRRKLPLATLDRSLQAAA